MAGASSEGRILSVINTVLRGLGWRLSRLEPGTTGHACRPVSQPEAYAQGWKGVPSLFVLSTGRVGTETLTALLNLSPDVHALHEPFPQLKKASLDAYMQGPFLPEDKGWDELVLAARDDLVIRAARHGKVYAETSNRLTFLASSLARVFPDSRFIHLYRHPYDVIRSGMRRGFYQEHFWDFYRVRPRPDEALAVSWETLPALQKVAWYWTRINEEAISFISGLPQERVLSLSAEEMFAGNLDTISALYPFAGARAPDEKSIRDTLGLKMNSQQSGDFPGAEEWSSEQLAQVNGMVRDIAARLGYDLHD